MVVGKSPEWLPPGFTEKVKHRSGRKIKYYLNVATGAKYRSKKDVIRCVTADNSLLGTPQTTNRDDNVLSSNDKVDAILAQTNDSPDPLLNGWTVEERTRQSGRSKGSIYRVYTDMSSGSKFYSRAAVTRYLNAADHTNTMAIQIKLDNVDETSPNMSPKCMPITNTDPVPKMEKKMEGNSFNTLDNVEETIPNMSPICISITNTDPIPEKEKKKIGNSFKTVVYESMEADDLPSGWIKEIRISKSGNKIRKDPYYIDPVSGYVFRSKLDAMRYLETNDIGSCACRPKRRDELDDPKSIKNEIPSSNPPANEKLSKPKRQLLLGGKSNGGNISDSAEILKQTQENEVSTANVKATDVDAAICLPVPDPSAKQQFLESGMEKQSDRTQRDLKNSKKRKNLSLPSRASKRLAGSDPEMLSSLVPDERSLRAAAKRSSGSEVDTSPSFSPKASASIPLPSNVVPAKEPAEHAFKGEENRQTEPLNTVEKPPSEDPAIPEEQTAGKASETQLDDSKRSQESQFCFDFGESWSDPLEFALKTLRGEIPIEGTLAFQENGCFRPSQPDPPIIFQNEFAPGPETSKQHGAVNQLQANSSSFSAPGNISYPTYSSFNFQSSTEVGEKDRQTKFNP